MTNWTDNIQIGDTIICSTKNGCTPVVVNKVEILDKCPIDIPVKKVCGKKIIRNGIVVEIQPLNVDFKAEILASLMGDVVVTYGERVQLSYCPDSMHHISVNRFKRIWGR